MGEIGRVEGEFKPNSYTVDPGPYTHWCGAILTKHTSFFSEWKDHKNRGWIL